jgi:hypothetical protein
MGLARVLMLTGLVMAITALCCDFARGQNKPEEASFKLQVGNAGGSGTGIDPHLVVTNAHVAQSIDAKPIIEHGWTGQRWTGQVVALDKAADLALVFVKSGGLPWVNVNHEGLVAGQDVFAWGYGKSRILRRGEGQVVGIEGTRGARSFLGGEGVPVWHTGLLIEPGDSGSGIFNDAGELVGVNWGAGTYDSRNAATSAKYIMELGQYWEAQCGGGSCNAFQGAGRQAAGGGGGRMVPVRPPLVSEEIEQPPTAEPPAKRPEPKAEASPPAATVDAEKLAESLVDKLANDPRFRGPKGDAGDRGEAGPPGPAGPAGKDAVIDEDVLVAKVLAKIDYSAIASQVKVAPPNVPTQTKQIHYVVVGDEGASYWSRISDRVRQTQHTFYGLQVAPPPKGYSGVLPVLVKYTDGVPQYTARGQYEVENALDLLARGEQL